MLDSDTKLLNCSPDTPCSQHYVSRQQPYVHNPTIKYICKLAKSRAYSRQLRLEEEAWAANAHITDPNALFTDANPWRAFAPHDGCSCPKCVDHRESQLENLSDRN